MLALLTGAGTFLAAALPAARSPSAAPTAGKVVAGVLAFRLATFWMPIIPGYLAFRSLTQRDLL